jgi:hypothetical protein
MDTWGMANYAAHICLVTVHVHDDLEAGVYVGGFGGD